MNVHSREPVTDDHGRHDQLLVARFAADDAYPGEQQTARALIDACPDCARLANDIRLISRTTGSLPPARRTRDFRISAADAERLRGSWLDRLLRRWTGPRAAVLQPLAAAALVLGLTLAVIGALPLGLAGSPALQTVTDSIKPVSGDVGTSVPAAAPLPTSAGPAFEQAPLGTAMGSEQADADKAPPATREQPADLSGVSSEPPVPEAGARTPSVASDTSRPLLVAGGAILAVLGLGLLAVLVIARRRTSDPLLR